MSTAFGDPCYEWVRAIAPMYAPVCLPCVARVAARRARGWRDGTRRDGLAWSTPTSTEPQPKKRYLTHRNETCARVPRTDSDTAICVLYTVTDITEYTVHSRA